MILNPVEFPPLCFNHPKDLDKPNDDDCDKKSPPPKVSGTSIPEAAPPSAPPKFKCAQLGDFSHHTPNPPPPLNRCSMADFWITRSPWLSLRNFNCSMGPCSKQSDANKTAGTWRSLESRQTAQQHPHSRHCTMDHPSRTHWSLRNTLLRHFNKWRGKIRFRNRRLPEPLRHLQCTEHQMDPSRLHLTSTLDRGPQWKKNAQWRKGSDNYRVDPQTQTSYNQETAMDDRRKDQ